MTLKKLLASVATATMLVAATWSAPAMAQSQGDSGFSALQGVEAQALSQQEMDAITGELNAYDISAALSAAATKLGNFPRLQAAALKLADYYFTNAEAINAAFVKLGIFTACKSCP